jgi:MGT family glycosyltransferase
LSKVAVFCIPAFGHVNPQLALVDGLVKSGEKVIYYTSSRFAPVAARTGAEVRLLSASFDELVDAMGATLGKNAFSVGRMIIDASAEILDSIYNEVKAEDPDYIIHDSITLFGRVIAKSLKKPSVATVPVFCLDERSLPRLPLSFLSRFTGQFFSGGFLELARYFSSALRMSKKYSVHLTDLLFIYNDYADLNIVTTSRQFQFHSASFPESRFKFVGPMLFERRDDGVFPVEKLIPGKSVYISLGTVYNSDTVFFRECIKALGNSGFSVVMSAGPNIDIQKLGEIPGNITVKNYIPQLRVLPYISVFITHAGMNSSQEGLLNGVPLICVPQANDQYIIANRAVGLKAAVYLKKRTAASILAAVNEVLGNPAYRRNALKIGGDLKNAGGVRAALQAIAEFKSVKGID